MLLTMYQEALRQMQEEKLHEAQASLESVLSNPLCQEAKGDQLGSANSLLQLRFLALKNLGEIFRQRGAVHSDDSIRCYLEAASIDGSDVVLWHRLGIQACQAGRLSIARSAFEQGVRCSPKHWGCLQKLAEVLIAIRDERACQDIARQTLALCPAHPRAAQIKSTIDLHLTCGASDEHTMSEQQNEYGSLTSKVKGRDNESHSDRKLKMHAGKNERGIRNGEEKSANASVRAGQQSNNERSIGDVGGDRVEHRNEYRETVVKVRQPTLTPRGLDVLEAQLIVSSRETGVEGVQITGAENVEQFSHNAHLAELQLDNASWPAIVTAVYQYLEDGVERGAGKRGLNDDLEATVKFGSFCKKSEHVGDRLISGICQPTNAPGDRKGASVEKEKVNEVGSILARSHFASEVVGGKTIRECEPGHSVCEGDLVPQLRQNGFEVDPERRRLDFFDEKDVNEGTVEHTLSEGPAADREKVEVDAVLISEGKNVVDVQEVRSQQPGFESISEGHTTVNLQSNELVKVTVVPGKHHEEVGMDIQQTLESKNIDSIDIQGACSLGTPARVHSIEVGVAEDWHYMREGTNDGVLDSERRRARGVRSVSWGGIEGSARRTRRQVRNKELEKEREREEAQRRENELKTSVGRVQKVLQPFITRSDGVENRLEIEAKEMKQYPSGTTPAAVLELNGIDAASNQQRTENVDTEEAGFRSSTDPGGSRDIMSFKVQHDERSSLMGVAGSLLEAFAAQSEVVISRKTATEIASIDKRIRYSADERSLTCTVYLAEIYISLAATAHSGEQDSFLENAAFWLNKSVQAFASLTASAGSGASEQGGETNTTDEQSCPSVISKPAVENDKKRKFSVSASDGIDKSQSVKRTRAAIGNFEALREELGPCTELLFGNFWQRQDLDSTRATACRNSIETSREMLHDWEIWARFYWAYGCWSILMGERKTAKNHFQHCLAVLENADANFMALQATFATCNKAKPDKDEVEAMEGVSVPAKQLDRSEEQSINNGSEDHDVAHVEGPWTRTGFLNMHEGGLDSLDCRPKRLSVIRLGACQVDNVISYTAVQGQLLCLDIEELVAIKAPVMLNEGKHQEIVSLLTPVFFPGRASKLPASSQALFTRASGQMRRHPTGRKQLLQGLKLLAKACLQLQIPDWLLALECHEQILSQLVTPMKEEERAEGIESETARRWTLWTEALGRENGGFAGLARFQSRREDERKVEFNVKKRMEVARAVNRLCCCTHSFFQKVHSDGDQHLSVSLIKRLQELLMISMEVVSGELENPDIGREGSCGSEKRATAISTLTDAAVTFCQLEQANASVSVKEQVDLLESMHSLLAQWGLCCSARGSMVGPGGFLKSCVRFLSSLKWNMKVENIGASNLGSEVEQLETKTRPRGNVNVGEPTRESFATVEGNVENMDDRGPAGEKLLEKTTNVVEVEVLEGFCQTRTGAGIEIVEGRKWAQDDREMVLEDQLEECDRKKHNQGNQNLESWWGEGVDRDNVGREGREDSEGVKASYRHNMMSMSEEKKKGRRRRSGGNEAVDEDPEERLQALISQNLGQCFYCLYKMNLTGSGELTSPDGLEVHDNTGDLICNTKKEAAELLHFLLPYTRMCSEYHLKRLSPVFRNIYAFFSNPPFKESLNFIDSYLNDADVDEEAMAIGECDVSERPRGLQGKVGNSNHPLDGHVRGSDNGGIATTMREVNLKEIPGMHLERQSELNPTQENNQIQEGEERRAPIVAIPVAGRESDVGVSPREETVDMASGGRGQQLNGGVGEREEGMTDGPIGRVKESIASGETSAYKEVHENLYDLVARVENLSVSSEPPGFILTKEGAARVQHNAGICKWVLCCHPERYDMWRSLGRIYDEEVNFLLNDGSKQMSCEDWHMDNSLSARIVSSRRRSLRAFLQSLKLAQNDEEKGEIHNLLAFVYYGAIQNVAPIYNQRHLSPSRDATWQRMCTEAFRHFTAACALKPDWIQQLYLGKLCEKMGRPPAAAFEHYRMSIELYPLGVDNLYRLHASRLKLLCRKKSKMPLEDIQILARHSFFPETARRVENLLHASIQDKLRHRTTLQADAVGIDDRQTIMREVNEGVMHKESSDLQVEHIGEQEHRVRESELQAENNHVMRESMEKQRENRQTERNETERKDIPMEPEMQENTESDQGHYSQMQRDRDAGEWREEIGTDESTVQEAWSLLFGDCFSAIRSCFEGELKHFHKARYCLARALVARGGAGDLEQAKEELGFCFKMAKSGFGINMWEIDHFRGKSRRKIEVAMRQGSGTGQKRVYEVGMREISRKFVSCLRKYLLFYIELCEKNRDLVTLERACTVIHNDRKFSRFLRDVAVLSLGRYIWALVSGINRTVRFKKGQQIHKSIASRPTEERPVTGEGESKENSEFLDEETAKARMASLNALFEVVVEHIVTWNETVKKGLKEAQVADQPEVSPEYIQSYILAYLESLTAATDLAGLARAMAVVRRRISRSSKYAGHHMSALIRVLLSSWSRALADAIAVISENNTAEERMSTHLPTLERPDITKELEQPNASTVQNIVSCLGPSSASNVIKLIPPVLHPPPEREGMKLSRCSYEPVTSANLPLKVLVEDPPISTSPSPSPAAPFTGEGYSQPEGPLLRLELELDDEPEISPLPSLDLENAAVTKLQSTTMEPNIQQVFDQEKISTLSENAVPCPSSTEEVDRSSPLLSSATASDLHPIEQEASTQNPTMSIGEVTRTLGAVVGSSAKNTTDDQPSHAVSGLVSVHHEEARVLLNFAEELYRESATGLGSGFGSSEARSGPLNFIPGVDVQPLRSGILGRALNKELCAESTGLLEKEKEERGKEGTGDALGVGDAVPDPEKLLVLAFRLVHGRDPSQADLEKIQGEQPKKPKRGRPRGSCIAPGLASTKSAPLKKVISGSKETNLLEVEIPCAVIDELQGQQKIPKVRKVSKLPRKRKAEGPEKEKKLRATKKSNWVEVWRRTESDVGGAHPLAPDNSQAIQKEKINEVPSVGAANATESASRDGTVLEHGEEGKGLDVPTHKGNKESELLCLLALPSTAAASRHPSSTQGEILETLGMSTPACEVPNGQSLEVGLPAVRQTATSLVIDEESNDQSPATPFHESLVQEVRVQVLSNQDIAVSAAREADLALVSSDNAQLQGGKTVEPGAESKFSDFREENVKSEVVEAGLGASPSEIRKVKVTRRRRGKGELPLKRIRVSKSKTHAFDWEAVPVVQQLAAPVVKESGSDCMKSIAGEGVGNEEGRRQAFHSSEEFISSHSTNVGRACDSEMAVEIEDGLAQAEDGGKTNYSGKRAVRLAAEAECLLRPSSSGLIRALPSIGENAKEKLPLRAHVLTTGETNIAVNSIIISRPLTTSGASETVGREQPRLRDEQALGKQGAAVVKEPTLPSSVGIAARNDVIIMLPDSD